MKGNQCIAFVGAGNMAGAIIDGILTAGIMPPDRIFVYDPNEVAVKRFSDKGVCVCSSNRELIKKSDIILIAVKPQIIDSVLSEISGLADTQCVISIAAGVSVSHIRKFLGNNISVIRALPNTPMLALHGMTVVAESPDTNPDTFAFVCSIFKAAGEVIVLPEEKINEAIPLSSSSPAFFFRMLDAMAQSGARHGIAYNDALKLSAAAMSGSAQMMLNAEMSPSELVRQVSSPGGTTVAALTSFNEYKFEELIDSAFDRCITRAYELGRSDKK